MKTYYPDKKSMYILRIVTAVIFLVIAAAVFFIVPARVIMLIVNVILLISALFIIFIYLPAFFSNMVYYISENEIFRKGGVFFRNSGSIRLDSVQHVSHVFIPFSVNSGFHFIVLYVFGGKMALLFLKKKDADEILHTVLKKENDYDLS